MTRRGPHHIGTTGAVPGDGLVYDPDADEYGPGDVVLEIIEGPGIDVDATDPKRPVVSATGGGSGGGELLMADGVTSPPVPIETEAGDDWLYQD